MMGKVPTADELRAETARMKRIIQSMVDEEPIPE
jgi:hypothetical protein